jgi:methylglutaconyl-CoA hydratase
VVEAIGARAARRYFSTAETFSAQSACELGLVSQIADDSELDQTVQQWVDAILGNGPQAVTAAKQLVAEVSGKPIDSKLIEYTCELIAGIRVSNEGQEGLQAFLQKRRPDWNGA